MTDYKKLYEDIESQRKEKKQSEISSDEIRQVVADLFKDTGAPSLVLSTVKKIINETKKVKVNDSTMRSALSTKGGIYELKKGEDGYARVFVKKQTKQA